MVDAEMSASERELPQSIKEKERRRGLRQAGKAAKGSDQRHNTKDKYDRDEDHTACEMATRIAQAPKASEFDNYTATGLVHT